jgi:hypothetical protein
MCRKKQKRERGKNRRMRIANFNVTQFSWTIISVRDVKHLLTDS